MLNRRCTLAAALTVAAWGLVPAARPVRADRAGPMRRHLWRDRVLVIFAPAADDARLHAQNAILRTHGDGLCDRDMAVWRIVGDAAPSLNQVPRPTAAAADFRRHFSVDADRFTVILLGKDGTLKLQRDRPVTTAALFAMIDAMPMRRREIRHRHEQQPVGGDQP